MARPTLEPDFVGSPQAPHGADPDSFSATTTAGGRRRPAARTAAATRARRDSSTSFNEDDDDAWDSRESPHSSYRGQSEGDSDDEEDDEMVAPTGRARSPRLAASATRALPRQVTPSPAARNAARSSSSGRGSARAPGVAAAGKVTPPHALGYEIAGVLLLATGTLLLYNARLQPQQIHGFLPQLAVGALHWLFGVGALVLPALMVMLGALLIVRRHRANLRAFTRGAGTAFLVLLTALHLEVPHGHEFEGMSLLFRHGGYTGGALAWLLRSAVGEIGAGIVLTAFSLIALLLWTEISLGDCLGTAAALVGGGARHAGRHARRAGRRTGETLRTYYGDFSDYDKFGDDQNVARASLLERRRRRAAREAERALLAAKPVASLNAAAGATPFDDLLTDMPHFGPAAALRPGASAAIATAATATGAASAAVASAAVPPTTSASRAKPAPAAAAAVADNAPRIEYTDAPPPASVVSGAPAAVPVQAELALLSEQKDDALTPAEALEAQALATATGGAAPKKKLRPEAVRRRFGDGPLMPAYFDDAVRALDPPVIPDLEGADEDVQAGVQAVQETLASFKIDARVTDVKRGPVITRYEVQPAPGVRVAAIANLDRDMARSLSAIAVRIEAPVPGKNVVGIEVPNKKVNLVRLRDVLERHEFLSSPSKLAFVLGKDIAGQPKWADLTKMPHMLIAGATNSGKSVCLNSIIASIMVRAGPEEVKFSLIDPKRVELTLFNNIRHLYHPVVVEPKAAVHALRGMIAEMDRRYKRFAERGVRNIVSYNSKLEEGEIALPYIVIVIDELADLMMTAAAEFEKLICRLAQLARATGIHLIVATQRPSVNVITGVIKANIPARVAFAVASQVDSRTILDSVGAERLIGMGDMLFDANNGGKAVRIQGTYLSEEEVNRVVEVVKEHYAADADDFEFGLDLNSMIGDDDEDTGNERTLSRDEKRDDLYDEILEYVVRSQEMSASMIQRKFEIGYPRAARIVDQFERDGILSGANGSKPRKVVGNGRSRLNTADDGDADN